MADSPVVEVSFSQALNITLDNYYDLLKAQIGGLQQEEYLQLKLVADTVDISPKPVSEGGYRYWSDYNLLKRSDTAIQPTPVSGEVLAAVKRLHEVYQIFLERLQDYVVIKNLSPEEQKEIADIDLKVRKLKSDANSLVIEDRTNWVNYAEALGYEVGDETAYFQWSSAFGDADLVDQKLKEANRHTFRKLVILDRQYPEPDDRSIVEAVVAFENPGIRLRYPFHPDYTYSDGDKFSYTYLARLPAGDTALFDDRHAMGWSVTIDSMKTGVMGAFDATLDNSTSKSTSIVTDWKKSSSVRYGWIKGKMELSEHTSVQEDFDKATKIQLTAKSAFRANINYPAWFNPSLFQNKRVKENISSFEEFLGPKGSLRFYPTAIILVRGFGAEFTSSQNWSFDYEKKFNANVGGGFSVFGIKFGSGNSYSKHEKTHKVDKSATSLKFYDDEGTLRFVGYAVKQTTVYDDVVDEDFSEKLSFL